MALPEPFSDIEHLQTVIRRYLNKQIREDFRDVFGDSDTWEPEINTTRGSMLRALLHEDSDPIHVTTARMMLYYFTYGAAKAMQPDIVGSSLITLDQQRKYRPQITLYFNNGKQYYPRKKNNLIEGEISFRLMDETATTITKTQINTFASRIKSLFAVPKFIWHKGKDLYSYCDWNKGYQLQLLVTGETEARRIIEQVLDIQGHIPDWKNLKVNRSVVPSETYPSNPGTEVILGETVEKPTRRPIEDVTFRYASILLNGRGRAITLVDTTYTKRNSIEFAS